VVTVAITHLDHMSEDQRGVQMSHVLEVLGSRPRAVLVGDLNALTRSDYSDSAWAVLEDRAASNGWSPPEPARCLDALRAAGFSDAYADVHGSLAGVERHLTAHVGHPLYRIDYCFVSRASGFRAVGAEVQTDVALSDHYPVEFVLEVDQSDARL